MAGKTLLKSCIAPIAVGQVPTELSWHTWYVMQEGAQLEATVHDTKARPPWNINKSQSCLAADREALNIHH